MTRLRVLLLAGVLAAPALSAQEGSSKVTFRVTRFDPSDAASPKFQVGSKRTDVEVPLTFIDGPFSAILRDGRYLDFFKGSEERPAITVDVPATMRKDLLLIFIPKDETFSVLQVHAPVSRIKGGDRYIVNATPADLAIKLGESEPITIPPAKSGILKGPGGNEIEALPVDVMQKTGDSWKLVSTEYWTCDPRFRSFLFIYRSERTGHVAFHGVRDRLDQGE